MNVEFIAEKWVPALRSGEYEQTQKTLRKNRRDPDGMMVEGMGYCCLGVACDILVGEGKLAPWENETGPWMVEGSDSELPYEAKVFIGMPSGIEGALIEMNDQRLASFDEIADFLERVVGAERTREGG